MQREITRSNVRDLVRKGLEEARGNYKIVARLFNMDSATTRNSSTSSASTIARCRSRSTDSVMPAPRPAVSCIGTSMRRNSVCAQPLEPPCCAQHRLPAIVGASSATDRPAPSVPATTHLAAAPAGNATSGADPDAADRRRDNSGRLPDRARRRARRSSSGAKRTCLATCRCGPDGRISLPLLNDIQAAGLTPEQLRLNITEVGEQVHRTSRRSQSWSSRSTAVGSSSLDRWPSRAPIR